MTAIDPRAILGDLSGGRVLDVATGAGGFVQFVLDGLRDHGEIIGIDTNPGRAEAFAAAFGDIPSVRFVEMDAHHLAFPDDSFDTACVSNSLHHLADPAPVLAEMRRVLRPGGHLLVNEMYRDGQSETQMTHVLLHHWWAAIDSAQGTFHAETYSRERILEVVGELGLEDLLTYDLVDLTSDPKDPTTVAQLATAVERTVERAGALAIPPELAGRGEALRRRIHDVGFHSATTLFAIGRTPRARPEA